MASSVCSGLQFIPEGREADYKGVRLDTMLFPVSSISRIETELEFHQDDVLLVGYPKTGTTWIQEVVWLICNNADVEAADKKPLIDRVFMLELSIPGVAPSIDTTLNTPHPRLMTSHLQHKFFADKIQKGKPRVIYMMRNPKDTFVSKYHFYNTRPGINIPTFNDFFELVRHDKIVFGDFFDHVIPWWTNRERDGTLCVRYEDMKRDHEGGVRRIAEYLGKELTDDQVLSIVEHTGFSAMKGRKGIKQGGHGDDKVAPKEDDNAFLRKGQIGGWRDTLTDEQSKYIDSRHEQMLADIDLKFEL